MKDRNSMDTDDYYEKYLGCIGTHDATPAEYNPDDELCDRDFIDEDIESEGKTA